MKEQVNERFQWKTEAKALEENIVLGDKYRFTVLTSQLIRLEYSENGVYEDRASQTVFYRNFPKVDFLVDRRNGCLTITTEELVLTYQENAVFSEDTLSVSLIHEPASKWRYGEDFEDLGGTVSTLDGVNGAIWLGRGICSRNGFSVMDDSESMVLGENGWVEVRHSNTKDVYFWGYGFEYLKAIRDFYGLTGTPPVLPAYALGNWWSRYHQYTQQEYMDLIEKFEKEDVPFSVSVVDMDWHWVEIPKEYHDAEDPWEGNGWTGYSWNTELFPDWKGFLKFLKKKNLKTALNLHPAAGVRKFDAMYREMAVACGADPDSGKRIPFNILSPRFMENYFDILHHPYEEAGVDFWWMDWQQGRDYHWIHEPNRDGKLQDEREILDPLWMLNHLHILDIKRNGKRPMFFSRFSGPGSHRYPVGFSGDTFITWESLRFQPYFTATASNIGYCWWSHDIGGHMGGYKDDELNTRWIQLGVFSPINRLHSSSSLFSGKEPWASDYEYEEIIKDYLRLRHRLFPYLYTMNYRTAQERLPLIQPMYYTHPKNNKAYEVSNQYWFGSELMVSALTNKTCRYAKTAKTEVWFPKGDWYDFFTGARYSCKENQMADVYRRINEYPVFAKAGAIIPMMAHAYGDNVLKNAGNMEVIIFPGADNQFVLYEDEGEYENYKNGAYAQTCMKWSWSDKPEFVIEPAVGDISVIPRKRTWSLNFRGIGRDTCFRVFAEDTEVLCNQEYDTETFTARITVSTDCKSRVKVELMGETILHQNENYMEKCRRILQYAQINYDKKHSVWEALQADSGFQEKVKKLSFLIPEYENLSGALREQLILGGIDL